MFESPRIVEDKSICSFYHNMTLANGEQINGKWDLDYDTYFGHVDFNGKRALDIGTASGALTWEMERRGADVVGFDLSTDESWDVVPSKSEPYAVSVATIKRGIRSVQNGWWYCHKKNGSSAKVVYGHASNIPNSIGSVDIAMFGSILLHLRDPFSALMTGLRLTRETVIVSDLIDKGLESELDKPYALFAPLVNSKRAPGTWWHLTPELIVRMLGILGFEDSSVSFHEQKHVSGMIKYFTVVAQRTLPFDPSLSSHGLVDPVESSSG